jgi:hypothetical protein
MGWRSCTCLGTGQTVQSFPRTLIINIYEGPNKVQGSGVRVVRDGDTRPADGAVADHPLPEAPVIKQHEHSLPQKPHPIIMREAVAAPADDHERPR